MFPCGPCLRKKCVEVNHSNIVPRLSMWSVGIAISEKRIHRGM